jgi:rare lipoprotein A
MALNKFLFATLCVLLFGTTSLLAQVEYGDASYYNDKYHLTSKTASGELYNKNKLTAAHKSYEYGTLLRVTNVANGRTVTVRVNDRGPYQKGRVIDISRAAAEQIDLITAGVAKVKVEVVSAGDATVAQGQRRSAAPSTPTVVTTLPATTATSQAEEVVKHGDLSKLPLRDHTGTLITEKEKEVAVTEARLRVGSSPEEVVETEQVQSQPEVSNPALREMEKYTPTIFRMIAIKENSRGFAVQLGAFFTYYRMLEGLSEINQKGVDNTLVQSGMKDGKPIFRILAGPYSSKAEADQAKAVLSRKGIKGLTINLSTLK